MADGFQASHVRDVSGYSKSEMRRMLRALHSVFPQRARVATAFSKLDLMTFAVLRRLQRQCGMGTRPAASLFLRIRAALKAPRGQSTDARLIVVLSPPSVTYSADEKTVVPEGVVVRLGPVFEKVDPLIRRWELGEEPNRELALPPVAVRQRTSVP